MHYINPLHKAWMSLGLSVPYQLQNCLTNFDNTWKYIITEPWKVTVLYMLLHRYARRGGSRHSMVVNIKQWYDKK